MALNQQENEFQQAIVSMARFYRWKVAYFHKAKVNGKWMTPVGADGKGWLDLILCSEKLGIIIARELKIPPRKTTDEQDDWIRVLNACGVDAKVWTPQDWKEIEMTLAYESTTP